MPHSVAGKVHPAGVEKSVIQAVVDFLLTFGFPVHPDDEGYFEDIKILFPALRNLSTLELKICINQLPHRSRNYIDQFTQGTRDEYIKIKERQTRRNPPPRPHAPAPERPVATTDNRSQNDQHYPGFNWEQMRTIVQYMLCEDYGDSDAYLLQMQGRFPILHDLSLDLLQQCCVKGGPNGGFRYKALPDKGFGYIYQFCDQGQKNLVKKIMNRSKSREKIKTTYL